MKFSYGLLMVFLMPMLAACERLGIEDPAAEHAREEAEGKAIGSGCRQTGRALEDCYLANRRAPKAAIFAGWREMDGYMRENKIEDVKPESAEKAPATKGHPLESAPASDAPAATPAQNPAAENGNPATGGTEKTAEPATAKPAAKAPTPRRSPLSR